MIVVQQLLTMKRLKYLTALALSLPFLASPLAGFAADQPASKADQPVKPYTLNFCVVSGDKLGEMGKPFVITNGTRRSSSAARIA